MRGKKAKLLRRVARRVTQGQPLRELKRDATTGQAVNSPTSTRGAYRKMKKWVVRNGKKRPFTDA